MTNKELLISYIQGLECDAITEICKDFGIIEDNRGIDIFNKYLAVTFANWLNIHYQATGTPDTWTQGGKTFTTGELYQIFTKGEKE